MNNMIEKINHAKELMQRACDAKGGQINIMEVCGTHTVSAFRNGLRSLFPDGLKLLSGPGCPVCVTDMGYIDLALQLADRDDIILATYGDMMRVPGSYGDSLEKKTRNNIKIVFSAENALELAEQNPKKTVVLVAVGFETTTPSSAVVVAEAHQRKIENFCILSNHKLVIPAMKALLSNENNNIDAFLCPGHVSVIIGWAAYKDIVNDYGRPCVVAGFEPLQMIEGIGEICRQLAAGKIELESVYKAVVTEQGNKRAQQIIDQYFAPADGYWRGLGKIPGSTYRLRDEYSSFDAFCRFDIKEVNKEDTSGCRCGEVLCGLMDPPQCELFGSNCTPDAPIGPCMVSSEGACAAWYKYGPRQ